MTIGITKADELITSPISFVSSSSSIAHIGGAPVFADVRDHQNIDPEEIGLAGSAICTQSRASADRHCLQVIENSCQFMGANDRGKRVGAF
jgi:dTDP-4-amino-4,6-dideoxygalactose transaminase